MTITTDPRWNLIHQARKQSVKENKVIPFLPVEEDGGHKIRFRHDGGARTPEEHVTDEVEANF